VTKILSGAKAIAHGLWRLVATILIASFCCVVGGGSGGGCDGELRIIAETANATTIPAILNFLFTLRKILKC
jgi:hypothetical protein